MALLRGIASSYAAGRRWGSDLALLVAPIWPLAWELLFIVPAALKNEKKKKKKIEGDNDRIFAIVVGYIFPSPSFFYFILFYLFIYLLFLF